MCGAHHFVLCMPRRHGVRQVCCSSPERFLRGEREGGLEARPIKGTAARSADPAADAAAAAELLASEKDRAENLMIVDLLRNDLGRVCQARSLRDRGLLLRAVVFSTCLCIAACMCGTAEMWVC